MPLLSLCLLALLGLVLPVLGEEKKAAEPEKLTLRQTQAKFAAADRKLNALWAELKKAQPEAQFAKLKAEQKDWLEYRDRMSYAPQASGAPEDRKKALVSPEFWSMSAGVTEERVEWLNGLAHPIQDPSPSGVWSDSYGGTIRSVEKAGRLYFEITVVRGVSLHLGSLSGVAEWKAPEGHFSDLGKVKGKEEETTVTFHGAGEVLTITGVNTSYYHGAHAFFDGDYRRVARLSPKEQAELIATATTEGAAEK